MPVGSGSATVDFAEVTEPFRRELVAHCYRMVGSLEEAEDLVQETYLKAWRAYSRFEGRSSVRTWMYRIATNACLTALQRQRRRLLPSGLGPASADGHAPRGEPLLGIDWLQPIPDALVAPQTDDPAAVADFRNSVRLALIASLQTLSPRQRAILLLREVLGWSATEVADALGTTTVAVKSSLQRARARLGEANPSAEDASEPNEPAQRALLDQYITAFENADAAALAKLLTDEATIEAPPFAMWVEGKATCERYLENLLVAPGDYLMFPTTANGHPAAAAYRRQPDGSYRAFGVSVIVGGAEGIARIIAFCDATLVPKFGFPETQQARG
jgi:RNA polymerase sigma-70 factor (ECF subfamily)